MNECAMKLPEFGDNYAYAYEAYNIRIYIMQETLNLFRWNSRNRRL